MLIPEVTILENLYKTLLSTEDYNKVNETIKNIFIGYIEYLCTTEKITSVDNINLQNIIYILQAIYNNSDITPAISDETYDKIYEIFRNQNKGKEIVGSSFNASDKLITFHKYPELRGTLNKVHFITKKDKGNDPRKSIECWQNTVENNLGRKLLKDERQVYVFPKWDGLSVIMECDAQGICIKAPTRGDTERNEAIDLSPLFKGVDFSYCADKKGIPFGLKTEVVISYIDYKELCEKEGNFKSPRSAVSSILNSKELDKKYLKYIRAIPLQIKYDDSVDIEIPKITFNNFPWCTMDLDNYKEFRNVFGSIKEQVDENFAIDTDGIVLRIINPKIQKLLGRENNINKYDIAYKFPAESKKTILKDISFSVGVLGGVTPLAHVEPIKIKGNTISNISLGSEDRFNSLGLSIGDEVVVQYDIIPYLIIDETCKRSTNNPVKMINKCPICESKLERVPVLRCVNPECSRVIIGQITNYVTKMRIANIDEGTITTFFQNKILRKIEDLYSLRKKRNEIINLDGFGEKSFEKIISGIDSRTEVHDYELLGAIGINGIGDRIFNKILNIYYLSELRMINVNKLTDIRGIKEKTAIKIIDGMRDNANLIDFLCSIIKIKSKDERNYKIKVCFSGIRDYEFEEYLQNKSVLVMDNYNKEIDILIVENFDTISKKIKKAQKDGKVIMTILDAHKKFNYKKK